MSNINLGDEVEDIITGLKGIVVAKIKWIYGCNRVIIQPRITKDNNAPDAISTDKPQVKVINANKINANPKQKAKRPAGPKPTPSRTIEVR